MPFFQQTHVLPYTVEQLYTLVIDIEKYPEFLPWCRDLKVIKRDADKIIADLVVGHGPFHETLRCHVRATPFSSIYIDYEDGPFKHLRGRWLFHEQGAKKASVDFEVDFEFSLGLINLVAEKVFKDMSSKMVDSFEKRAQQIYG
jgi:coenzyme Q-binding protein COQ10